MPSVMTDLAVGATSGVFKGIGELAKSIRVALTGVDPEKQAEIQEKMMDLLAAADEIQSKVNAVEAANPSLFVSGWRPAVGWICTLAFAYNFIVTPLLQAILLIAGSAVKLPELDVATMMPVLLGMLGLGGLRTYEKYQGVERK